MWLLTTCWLMSSQSLSSGMFHCLPPHTPQSSQFLLSHMVSYGMEYLLAGLGQLSWLCLLQAPCAPPDLQLVQISFAWSVKVIINHSFTWIILSRYHSAFPVFILIHLVPLYGMYPTVLWSCLNIQPPSSHFSSFVFQDSEVLPFPSSPRSLLFLFLLSGLTAFPSVGLPCNLLLGVVFHIRSTSSWLPLIHVSSHPSSACFSSSTTRKHFISVFCCYL